MLTLFAAPGSCSICAHAALIEGDVPHRVVFVTLHSPESPLLSLNPLGKVPTILTETGEVITQSSVVLPFIADLAVEKRLVPPSGSRRREVMQWFAFLNSDVHPAIKMLAGPADRYCSDPIGLKKTFTEHLHRFFSLVEEALSSRQWLTGDDLTIADLYAGAAMKWAETREFPITQYNSISRFRGEFEALPSIVQARAAEAYVGVI